MNRSMKAALLSAFVFPGIGHLFLKKYAKGAFLAGIAIVSIYFLLSTTVELAQEISAKIQSGEIPLDVTKITEAISRQAAGSTTTLVNISTFLFVICWLIGIFDSYRIGRSQDKGDGSDAK